MGFAKALGWEVVLFQIGFQGRGILLWMLRNHTPKSASNLPLAMAINAIDKLELSRL